MLTLKEWFAQCEGVSSPWLILGKGPSFALRARYDTTQFKTLALNHVIRELPATASHIIDIDVVEACADAIDRQARFLLMPFRPHVRNRPGPWDLTRYLREHPILQKMEREGRLVGYALSTGSSVSPDGSPIIKVKYFSAEAALRILVTCGARRIRSLGIDGGRTYSRDFSDLQDVTLLSNGRRSFDEQFQEIAQILHSSGIEYSPLHLETPIRIYVGTTASQELAYQVLAYSISRHASMTAMVIPMRDMPVPLPIQEAQQPRTPFSFSRFLIPELSGFQGKALYLDADMLVFQDVAQLWTLPFDGADVLYAAPRHASGRPDQFSVLALNCDYLRWDIRDIVHGLDTNEYSYEELLHQFCLVSPNRLAARIPSVWNSLEYYKPELTALLHYTDMHRQPWVSLGNPLGHLWVKELLRAVQERRITLTSIEQEIQRGHVRPSLLAQIRGGWIRPTAGLCLMDRQFTGPYQQLLNRKHHRQSLRVLVSKVRQVVGLSTRRG